MESRSTRDGFSLITFFVIVVALGLLIFFLFPSFSMVRERGRRTTCLNYMCQKSLALSLYRADHKGASPTHITELTPYIGGDRNVNLFMCPTRNLSLKGPFPKRISELLASPQYVGFDYLSATTKVPDIAVSETIFPQMCEKPGNHGKDGINILFQDGHASWWPGTIEEYAASNSLVITVNTNWVR